MIRPFTLIMLMTMICLAACFDQLIPQPSPLVSPLLVTPTRPLVPTYTPTATFTPTPMPTWTPQPAPTVANYNQFIAIKPSCTAITDYQQCYDPILDISFEYPDEWGEITATLSNPTYALNSIIIKPDDPRPLGYAYWYDFSSHFTEPQLNGIKAVIANGRSSNFSIPRDGSVYDFSGFVEQDTRSFCKSEANFAICHIIKPGVVIQFLFPKAEYFCITSSMVPPPTGFVYINLPSRRLINGFMFAYPLLSPAEEQSLYGVLGVGHSEPSNKCDDNQAKEQFDQAISELANGIKSGNARDDVLQRVNKLLRLANSIQGQETSR